MTKRLFALTLASVMTFSMVLSGTVAMAAESDVAYIGFGSVSNFREGPGKDDTGTPVYSFNSSFAVALFDAQGRIIDSETDILEVSTPNYDGASMPHFTGWPTSAGYNTYDHASGAIVAPTEVTVDFTTAEVAAWQTKRERGASYGMNETNDWFKQMDFYESWFSGKTVAEIRAWLDKNGTSAGRPIKLDTTNEADQAKLAKLTDAEKAELADVLSGATMSLEDPHGMTVTALERAYANRVPVKASDIASLGLATDKIFRAGPGTDEEKNPVYSLNFVMTGVAFDSNGAIAAVASDILELATPNYDGASMPHFPGWPGTSAYFTYDHATQTLISPASAEQLTYRIVDGDMLWKIAAANSTTIEAILALNPQIKDKNLIYAGQTLALSSQSASLVSVEDAKAYVDAWKTKRERGDAYGMNAENEWYKQMNFYQDWMVGQTPVGLSAWFEKYTTSAGRPIKAETTNEADKAKYGALTDAEKAALADVVAGATMSLEDPHGRTITTINTAYQNRKAVAAAVPTTPAAPAAPEADTVSSASVKESSDPKTVAAGLSANGYWIFSILSDVTIDKAVTVEGTFYNKDDATSNVYRKLALYAQDAEHKVTAEYTLTVPELIVNSPNFRIQNGTVKGDVTVNAEGFDLNGAKIEGKLVFATQELMDSAKFEAASVSGGVSVGAASEADTVSSASVKESSDPAAVVAGLSAEGYWIFSVLSDVTLDKAVTVDGTFYNKDDKTSNVYRKLALYAQDAEHKVTAEYTLTVPELIVNSPSFRIQNGTVKGDVTVNAEGFDLNGAKIDGKLVFATQALLDSAKFEAASVSGGVSVK